MCPYGERKLLKLTRKYTRKNIKRRQGEIKMEQENQKIYLTADTLKELGSDLTDIMNRLEMTNHVIEGLE